MKLSAGGQHALSNGPPQSFWGLFGWFSTGVEVQYLLHAFPKLGIGFYGVALAFG